MANIQRIIQFAKFIMVLFCFLQFFLYLCTKMTRITRFLARTISLRLSLMVLVALASLLMAALFIMFCYSRKAVKEEALQKADQTLETIIQSIDNVMLSVEQSSGNIYWKMMAHQGKPEKIELYRKKLIEFNPYIIGCSVILDSTFNAINTTVPCWTDVKVNDSLMDKASTSFCLPIYFGEKKAGMLVSDVSLTLLSKIVLEAKPSPNSYCTLIGNNGTLIVHPDSSVLNQNMFTLANKAEDPAMKEIVQAMMEGDKGYRHIKLDGKDCYVFYKPFERADVPGRYTERLGWSAAVVYPEDDIFGEYNELLYIVLIIAVVGLALLLLLCQTFIHRQLLPLRLLAKSAHRIAKGYYDEPIPSSKQQDEVGRLQKHFQQMQQSLATRVREMKQLTDTLQERGDALQTTYEQAQVAEQMKTSFLYNMSNQMMAPARGIYTNVMTISKNYKELTDETTNQLVDEIHYRGEKITELLNQLISDSEKQMK